MPDRIIRIQTMGPRGSETAGLTFAFPAYCRETGKRRFTTKTDAVRAVEAAFERGALSDPNQRAYRCDRCAGGWHLTRKVAR
jgi:hypothetical protein